MWLSHVYSPHMEIHTPDNPTVDVVSRVELPNLEQGISELVGRLCCTRTDTLTHCTIISDKETEIWTLVLLFNTFVEPLMKMAPQTIIDPLSNWSDDDDAGSITFAKESPDSSPPVIQCRPALTCEEDSTGYAKLGAHAIVVEPETSARRNDQVFPARGRFNCSNRFAVLAAKQLKSH